MSNLVRFQLQDIVHPTPVDVLRALYAQQRLEGTVIAVTDNGRQTDRFLVVQVTGLEEPIIVPACKTTTP